MKTSKNNTSKNLDKILESSSDTNYKKPIYDNLASWLEQTKKILKQLHFINYQNDYIKKQQLLKKLQIDIENDMKFIEYLITDNAVIDNTSQFNLLRHNYYSIQNQILKIQNDIISEKTDNSIKSVEKTDDKISELENKFEGLGGTVITIILSITVISSSIVAIEKISAELIPLFIIGMVWLGVTFLTYTNFLFRKKESKILIPLLFYLAFTALFLVILFITIYK